MSAIFAKYSTSSFSADSPEFVPSFLKSKADPPEFVPSFLKSKDTEFIPYAESDTFYSPLMAPVEAPQYSSYSTPGAQCMLMNLDDYSDESSDDDMPSAKPTSMQQVDEQTAGSGADKKLPPWKQATKTSEEEGEMSPSSKSESNSPSSQPITPSPSTCEPESDSFSLDSDTEKEHESEPCESPGTGFEHTIANLLQLRHAVDIRDGYEERLQAMEMEIANDSDSSPKPSLQQSAKYERPRQARGGNKSSANRQKAKVQQKKPPNVERDFSDCRQPQKKASDADKESPKLEVSDDSWVSQQMARRAAQVGQETDPSNDETVVRAMKSILNKLTIEKFAPLCEKLVSCGISSKFHLETLINEVFEKATTQHHFINMYADLCELLHAHFQKHPISIMLNFKKVLLNACQAFFERNLKAPTDLGKLDEEERMSLERKYKMQMLGNIKFVGALLVRQMLASKVLFAICEELLTNHTPETLESLACLLTVVGPKFDIPEWPSHHLLAKIFEQVQALTKQPKVNCRVRCLLKDVLELRASRWHDRKPKKVEGPSTLKEVAEIQASEEGTSKRVSSPTWGHQGKSSPCHSGNFDWWAPKRVASYPMDSSKPNASTDGYQRINSLLMLKKGKDADQKEAQAQPMAKPFDKEAWRKEVSGALTELRTTHDVTEALLRMRSVPVPSPNQAEELCDMLGHMVEEGSVTMRKLCFELVAGLFKEGHWTPDALENGLEQFVNEVCPDLKYDVPSLPKILQEELHRELTVLVNKGVLKASLHDTVAAAC